VKRTFLEATESLAQAEARAAAGKPPAPTGPVMEEVGEAGDAAEAEPAGPEVPPPADAVQPVEAAAPAESPVDAPTAEAENDGGESADGAPAMADIDSLFARIRAGTEHGPEVHAPGDAAAGADGAADQGTPSEAADIDLTEASGSEADDADNAADADDADDVHVDVRAPWRDAEAAAVEPLLGGLVKQAKRAAQDEQNTLLDALRRHKGRPTSDQVLQSEPDAITSWGAILRTGLDTAYGAGRVAVGGDAVGAPPDLTEDAVRHVVMPLRERLAHAIDDDNDGYSTTLVIERIGARYREWKLQWLEAMAGDILASAWSRGVFDAVPDGTLLQWVPAEEGRCPDCDDNALEPTVKGEAFPTGQAHPPAHPGCRCILAPA
jgi:hypothetical protein